MNPSKGEQLIPSLEGNTPELAMGLEAENHRMREHLVFVDVQIPEIKNTLEIAAERIRNFTSNIKQLAGIVEGLAYDSFSAGLPEANHIADMVEGFNTGSLGDLILAIDRATESGIMTDGFASVLGYGNKVSDPNELKKAVSRILYNQCIWRSYDKVIIALEQFKNLEYIVDIPAEYQDKYKGALEKVRPLLEQTNDILSQMGITPAKINLFNPIDERTAPFVKYTSIRPKVKNFYPSTSLSDQPELVLSAKTWAYLDFENKLWQGHRAELIVSK